MLKYPTLLQAININKNKSWFDIKSQKNKNINHNYNNINHEYTWKKKIKNFLFYLKIFFLKKYFYIYTYKKNSFKFNKRSTRKNTTLVKWMYRYL